MNATIVRTPLVLVLALLVFAMFGATSSAIACTKSWASAVDGSWSDGTKWLPAGSPSSGDDVCIVVNGTYTVTLNVNGATNAFTLGGTTGTQKLDLPGTTSMTFLPRIGFYAPFSDRIGLWLRAGVGYTSTQEVSFLSAGSPPTTLGYSG